MGFKGSNSLHISDSVASVFVSKQLGRMKLLVLFFLIPRFFHLSVAIFGWISFDSHLFWRAWNVSGLSNTAAVLSGLNVQLWALTGLESAAVVAAVVKDPHRNVPIATLG